MLRCMSSHTSLSQRSLYYPIVALAFFSIFFFLFLSTEALVSVKPPWILSAIHKGNPWNPIQSKLIQLSRRVIVWVISGFSLFYGMCSDFESQKQNYPPIRKKKEEKRSKLVLIMLTVWQCWLCSLTLPDRLRGANVTVGTSYVSSKSKVMSLLQGTPWGSHGQGLRGSHCQKMGTLVIVNVLDSVVRCVTNQIPFYRPSLSMMLVLSDVLAFQKYQFQFISLLSLKLF